MYGLTTQCIGKTYQMFQLSATGPNLCLQPKSSHDQSFDRRPTAGCLTNYYVASTHEHLAQNFIRPAPMSLPRFCYVCSKI